MNHPPHRRIVLVGLSGTGKSTLARLLADRLDWSVIDTDADIEASFGKPIPRIFAEHGETAFRSAERAALVAAIGRDRVVVATGGGAVAAEDVWATELLADPETLTIALDAPVETLQARLVAQQAAVGDAVVRPMLAGSDPVGRMSRLKAERDRYYSRASLSLDVTHVDPELLADDIATLIEQGNALTPDVTLTLPTVASRIYVRPGVVERAAELIGERWPRARRVWVLSDVNVDGAHGDRIVDILGRSGTTVARRVVPAGEGSKSWGVAGELVNWLVDGGLQRSDVVVALGGGVVGDLAGFVAAVALRGVGLVQIPTTLLAMVDSSVGGKTGINLPAGKNLAGAFYQPPLVLVDPDFLRTLPGRELTAGWAEVVKHAVIQPSTPGGGRADLLPFLERNGDALRTLSEPATSYLLRRNVALKAAVVAADEREAGLRAILNYGHTVGHGIEAAGYRSLHGEAIAVGMRAAGWIAHRLGRVDAAPIDRHGGLLDAYGLPDRALADPRTVLARMEADKKKSDGRQQWVLADRAGGVTLTTDVPRNLIEAAVLHYTEAPAEGRN